ncbi:MAG: D-alanyl-D-alanine carboxypeptidase family protein [Oscillospiraceae bacterium]
MRKILYLLPICLMMIFSQNAYAFESFACYAQNSVEPPVEALSAIVIEAKSGRILYAKDVNQKLPMASTTKILTTIIALEQPNKEEKFVIDQSLIAAEGSSMGLRDGDIVNLDCLALGMMLPSGNDAANAAAIKISGSKEKFAELMNEKAQEIGMYDSHFVTPSGLDDVEHYTTANDMAILTAYALRNDQFREICCKSKQTVMLGTPPTERTLFNYNKLLQQYEYCIGVKTGYTDNARRCLVTAASKDGIELIIVTLNCHDDFASHKMLYDYFFDRLKLWDLSYLTDNLSVPVAGQNRRIKAKTLDIPLVPLLDGDVEKLKTKITLKKIIYAPINANSRLGELEIYSEDELIYKTQLISEEKVQIPTKKFSKRFNFQ